MLTGDLGPATVGFVRASDELTSTDDDWRVRSIGNGPDGSRHVRLDQLHAGVKVWGADIVVHVGADGRFAWADGNLVRGLSGLNVTPTLAAADALAKARAEYAARVPVPTAPLTYKREKTELVILTRPKTDAHLAWHVQFFTELQAGMQPGRWETFVDAGTGAVLYRFNSIHTLSQASGPGGNARVSRTWTNALDVEPSGSEYIMETARLRTYDMMMSDTGGVIVTGPLDPIGDAPINDAHGFAEVTLNMLDTWFGHNSIDDMGFLIQSRVHYGFQYENAFWDGTQMTYGDGATIFYPLSGDVDVVAHEINHGFTEFHSGLIYSDESGGLNESFSDISGTVADFFIDGDAGDWDLGADVFMAAGEALRYMCDPTLDGVSIDNYDDYGGQDVHYSSGISNKAFCRAARRLASGSPTGAATQASVRRAARAWYEANSNYWTQSTTFEQGCQGVMDAANALGYTTAQKDRIRTSWADVGVYCDGQPPVINCDDTLTASSGTIQSPNYPSNYPDNYRHTWCIRPASGGAATLTFNAFDTEFSYDFVNIKDGNTNVQFSNTSGSVAPPPSTSSYLVVKFTTDFSVTYTGWQASWTTGPAPDAPPPPDARPPDARPPDARPPDARPPDARPPDARPPDARPPDAAPPVPDAAPPVPDAAAVDASPPRPDANTPPDDGGGCCSTGTRPTQALPLVLVVGGLLWRRPRRRRRS